MKTDYIKRLQTERQKLDSLIDAALTRNMPIDQTHDTIEHCGKIRLPSIKTASAVLRDEAVREQCRKVEELIARRNSYL